MAVKKAPAKKKAAPVKKKVAGKKVAAPAKKKVAKVAAKPVVAPYTGVVRLPIRRIVE